jgi:hypothetical protein
MRHIRRFNENNEMDVHDSIFGKNKFKINQESRIEDFKKEFKSIVEAAKVVLRRYNEDDFEQGGEPSMSDILSEVGDLCNKYEMDQEDLKKLIDNGDDIDGILKDLYDFGYEEGELNKEYTEEDVKNFGLWLGNNIKKFKNRTIDDLFDEWKKL